MYEVTVEDFPGWRSSARELLKAGVEPAEIAWRNPGESRSLFGSAPPRKVNASDVHLPRQFVEIAGNVACHRDAGRWALLYRVAWRTLHEHRQLLCMHGDSDVRRLLQMQKQIARDVHKMKAFVRFRQVQPEPLQQEQSQQYFVAWFEPEHRILPRVAQFFTRRFAGMNWSVLTPDGCAHWNGQQLSFSEPISTRPQLDDELDSLWLTYYRSIFNPARLKLKAMQAEMPKKYWKNLPEAVVIDELTREASMRTNTMLEQPINKPWQKTAASSRVRNEQAALRERAGAR